MMGKRWYVVHAYSGFEKSVQRALTDRIRRSDIAEQFGQILVPVEEVVEMKGGQKAISERKFFPGYVLVEMNVTDDSWYVVRNTPGVTGFVGSGTTPVPMSDAEVENILKRMKEDVPSFQLDIDAGTPVIIVDGPFKNFEGKVIEVDASKSKVKVLCSMFGRETPIELDFLQIKKL